MSGRRHPVKLYVSAQEHGRLLDRAQSCDLPVSVYLRTLGTGHEPKSTLDAQAILSLVKLNADQGWLGGLLKLWLSERPGEGGSVRGRPSAAPDRGGADRAARHDQAAERDAGRAVLIAKRVRRARGDSFKRLAGYIAKREVVKWQRTADYILDTLGKGARATGVRITNCQSEELVDALAEITATQKRNRRARGERTYHLVISFPEGERPEPDQLRDIEDELCAAIGLGLHQRLSAIHTDTAHLHIHVAINQCGTYSCNIC